MQRARLCCWLEHHYRRRRCRNIWLLVTSPTTSTRPQWTKRRAARSTRSTKRRLLPASGNSLAALGPRSHCERRPMAESSSPTGRTLRPRNTSAVFGYWNALTWTRRWHGRAKASPPPGAGRGARDLLQSVTRLKQLGGLEGTDEGKRAAKIGDRRRRLAALK
jgi:hypothetical protein